MKFVLFVDLWLLGAVVSYFLRWWPGVPLPVAIEGAWDPIPLVSIAAGSIILEALGSPARISWESARLGVTILLAIALTVVCSLRYGMPFLLIAGLGFPDTFPPVTLFAGMALLVCLAVSTYLSTPRPFSPAVAIHLVLRASMAGLLLWRLPWGPGSPEVLDLGVGWPLVLGLAYAVIYTLLDVITSSLMPSSAKSAVERGLQA